MVLGDDFLSRFRGRGRWQLEAFSSKAERFGMQRVKQRPRSVGDSTFRRISLQPRVGVRLENHSRSPSRTL